MFHFSISSSPVLTRMVNITDVPFPFRSGWEENQVLTLQQKDAVLQIFLYNFKKDLGKLEFLPRHVFPHILLSDRL